MVVSQGLYPCRFHYVLSNGFCTLVFLDSFGHRLELELRESGLGDPSEHSDNIERFTENQAFSLSYDLAPTPPPSPRQRLVSISQSSCVSPVELTDGGGLGRSQIRRWRESLVLYKSFNTL
jgi:hypothetical protein